MTTERIPKFKVGQVVAYQRGKKPPIVFIVRQVIFQFDTYFYRFDRKNCISELRELTTAEKG